MSGIFGYVGTRDDASRVVLKGLRQLESRGYDSWGVAVCREGTVELEKRVGKIGQAQTTLPASSLGLGHTRWATHGGVTEANAHPHSDCSGRLAVIHNGVIENYQDLRSEVRAAGHTLRSETDSEVVAHLLEDEQRQQLPGPDGLLQALSSVFRRLEGLNVIAVLDTTCERVAAAKSGSPLVVGRSRDGSYLASDPNALMEHTNRMTFVENRQVVLLEPDLIRLFDLQSGKEFAAPIAKVTRTADRVQVVGQVIYT